MEAGIRSGFAFDSGFGSGQKPYSLAEMAELLRNSSHALEQEFASQTQEQLSKSDVALANIVNSPLSLGLLHSLKKNSVESVAIPEFDANDPRDVLKTTLKAGNAALRENGIAPPDLQMFERAYKAANENGGSFKQELQKLEASSPALSLRRDMPVNDRIDLTPSDTVGSGHAKAFAVAENETGQDLGKDFEAVDYREYDVHLMAYPLGYIDLPGRIDIATRDSHAFVVITEKGGNPYNPEEALLVTRAGPDKNGLFGSSASSSDSSFDNEQSPTEKGSDGDVYVEDFENSATDLLQPGIYHLQSARIIGDINEIKNDLAAFREFVNGQNIDYKLLSQNSNTYAGDAFELLTGQEPNNPYNGALGRRTPALDNDLVDYGKTEYGDYFD